MTLRRGGLGAIVLLGLIGMTLSAPPSVVACVCNRRDEGAVVFTGTVIDSPNVIVAILALVVAVWNTAITQRNTTITAENSRVTADNSRVTTENNQLTVDNTRALEANTAAVVGGTVAVESVSEQIAGEE